MEIKVDWTKKELDVWKPKDKLLRVSTVAGQLNCSKQTVYNLVVAGHLKIIRTGLVAGIRVFESSMDDFIKKRSESE